MKKLFISCPMRGRTEENIKKSMEDMHKLAEIMFGEKLEVLNGIIAEEAPECKQERIWYLGKSIENMSQADYFIGIEYYDMWSGCAVECRVARDYGIPTRVVNIGDLNSLQDCIEIENKRWEMESCCPVGGGN